MSDRECRYLIVCASWAILVLGGCGTRANSLGSAGSGDGSSSDSARPRDSALPDDVATPMDTAPPSDAVSPMDLAPADMTTTTDLSSGDTTGPAVDASELAMLCTSSGGQVASSMCCLSATAFPSNCAVGVCGCGPSSHLIATCSCPTGQCFDPLMGCVVGGLP